MISSPQHLSPGFSLAELDIDKPLMPPWYDSCVALRIPIRVPFGHGYPGDRMTLKVYKDVSGSKIMLTGKDGFTTHPDLNTVLKDILLEKYCVFHKPLISRLPFNYRRLPLSLRYHLAKKMIYRKIKIGNGSYDAFPSFPVERSPEALKYAIGKTGKVGWPGRKRYCVVLTHDLEERISKEQVKEIIHVEKNYGLRSCWFVTGALYSPGHSILEYLVSKGFEIGLHGYLHDGRLPYLSPFKIRERLERCESLIERYRITGFRSPNYQRSPLLFKEIAKYFSYDSSVPDVDIFFPGVLRGGSCTTFPYSIDGLVELPVTLPYDIPFLAGYPMEKLLDFWLEKIEWVKNVGGLLLLNIHPYPYSKATSPLLNAYQKFLDHISGDDMALKATPGEVAKLYRRKLVRSAPLFPEKGRDSAHNWNNGMVE